MKQQRKYREPKDTAWGKCLSGFIAIVFAVSTLTIIPIAGAMVGAATDPATLEQSEGDTTKQTEVEKPIALPTHQIVELEEQAGSADAQGPTDEKQGGNASALPALTSDEDDTSTVACNCTGAVHDDDCEAGLTGPVKSKSKDAEGVGDETLISPATEPEPPVWQFPTSEQTLTSYTYCTSKKLSNDVSISTAVYSQLGTEEGMTVSAIISGISEQEKDNVKYVYARTEVQDKKNGQVDAGDKSAYGHGTKISALRFNQNENAWQYKEESSEWTSIGLDQYVTFYYSQKNPLTGSNIILNTPDWGNLQPDTVASKSGGGCVAIQLYDVNGEKIGGYLPIYYYSPYADKSGCSFIIGKHWNVENVALKGVANGNGKLLKNAVVNVEGKIPSKFGDFATILPESQKNDFVVPFKSSWEATHGSGAMNVDYTNGDINVYIVGVQVSAEKSEQSLTVRYLDNEDSKKEIAQSQNAVAKNPDGSDNPVWADYIELKRDGKAYAKKNAFNDGGSNEVVYVQTDLNNGAPSTLSLVLNDATGYKSANHVRAEFNPNDNNVLNLYFEPSSYTVTYTDGVDDVELFADQSNTVFYKRATPAFEGIPTRDGYLFTGWADADGNAPAETVTGDVTYYAQWEELYTVSYDLNGGRVAEGTELVYNDLRSGSKMPTIANPTRANYVFAGWNEEIAPTVTGNATYTATWDEDNIGNPNDPEKKGPDGIADKYQKLVTFAVAQGSWNTGGDASIVEVLTFYKDGVLSTDADATAVMPVAPAVGENPDTGFYKGYRSESWHAAIPTGNVKRSGVLALYTYTYAAAYAVTYADGANGTVFANQTTDNLLYGADTPAFNGAVPARAGYVFAGWNEEIADKVTGNVTYTATWDEDVLGNDPANPGNVDYSDGIADKYQAVVTFAGVGGTVGGKTQFDYAVTLKDATGNNAVDGTYTLVEADVPVTAAAEGYAGNPVWTVQNPAGVTVGPEGAAFVASWGNGFVAYYYDGALGVAVDANVGVGETIDVDAAQSTTFEDHSYVLDRVENNNATVVAGDPGQNVVSVYYDLDEVGNDPANPGNVDHPDGIADKYQVIINYVSAGNGTVTGATARVETLLDADGNYAEAASIVPGSEGVVATPAEGYELGNWTPDPDEVINVQGGETYVYACGFNAVQTDEPENPPVDPTQPEDPDTPVPPTEPTNPTQPENPDTPVPPTEPTNPTQPENPDAPVSPAEPTTPADATPTPEPGPIATLATPVATAAAAAAVEAIGDAENPLAAITVPEEQIGDDANALAAFEDIHCWTHWLMLFGALVTIVYGLGVLYARRHNARDMDDFEDHIMGRKREEQTSESRVSNGAYQAM